MSTARRPSIVQPANVSGRPWVSGPRPSQAGLDAPGTLQKCKRFWFEDNITIKLGPLIEQIDPRTTRVVSRLYCVPAHVLSRESSMFKLKIQQQRTKNSGMLELPNVIPEELEAVLSVLFPEDIERSGVRTTTQWISVLRFTSPSNWDFPAVRRLAIRNLNRISALASSGTATNPELRALSPLEKLTLARDCEIVEWVEPALIALCLSPNFLTREEHRSLHPDDFYVFSNAKTRVASLQGKGEGEWLKAKVTEVVRQVLKDNVMGTRARAGGDMGTDSGSLSDVMREAGEIAAAFLEDAKQQVEEMEKLQEMAVAMEEEAQAKEREKAEMEAKQRATMEEFLNVERAKALASSAAEEPLASGDGLSAGVVKERIGLLESSLYTERILREEQERTMNEAIAVWELWERFEMEMEKVEMEKRERGYEWEIEKYQRSQQEREAKKAKNKAFKEMERAFRRWRQLKFDPRLMDDLKESWMREQQEMELEASELMSTWMSKSASDDGSDHSGGSESTVRPLTCDTVRGREAMTKNGNAAEWHMWEGRARLLDQDRRWEKLTHRTMKTMDLLAKKNGKRKVRQPLVL